MKVINKIQASVMIEKSNGKFFSVEFIKKNGERRRMLARKGVKKYATGRGSRYNPIEKTLSCVFDVQKEQYRMVNLNTIRELVMNGTSFKEQCKH